MINRREFLSSMTSLVPVSMMPLSFILPKSQEKKTPQNTLTNIGVQFTIQYEKQEEIVVYATDMAGRRIQSVHDHLVALTYNKNWMNISWEFSNNRRNRLTHQYTKIPIHDIYGIKVIRQNGKSQNFVQISPGNFLGKWIEINGADFHNRMAVVDSWIDARFNRCIDDIPNFHYSYNR